MNSTTVGSLVYPSYGPNSDSDDEQSILVKPQQSYEFPEGALSSVGHYHFILWWLLLQLRAINDSVYCDDRS